MTILMNGKKISKEKAIELIGSDRLESRIREAEEAYYEDPLEEISWMDGMKIVF